ncbi:MAG: hypothetical protein ACKOZU_06510 [Planctomycetaceae bacterium]
MAGSAGTDAGTTLGVLGDDPVVAAAVAAARGRGWGVVVARDGAEDAADAASWTSLLDPRTCDAVIVGATAGTPPAPRPCGRSCRPAARSCSGSRSTAPCSGRSSST